MSTILQTIYFVNICHLSMQCRVLVQSNCVGCDHEIDTDAFSSIQGFTLEFCLKETNTNSTLQSLLNKQFDTYKITDTTKHQEGAQEAAVPRALVFAAPSAGGAEG